MIIETPNLLIRPIARHDAPEVQAAKEEAWPELQRWMSWAYDHMLPLSALEDYIASRPPQNPWDAAIAIEKASGRFAVMSGVAKSDEEPGTCGTGYWTARAMRGKGYANEATNALTRHAFTHMGCRRMRIDYYEDNEPSRRIIEKLGFTFLRTVEGGHKRCLDGTPLDVHKFEMTDPAVLPPVEWRLVTADYTA